MAATAVVLLQAVVLAAVLPQPLVLPAFALSMLTVGFILAAANGMRKAIPAAARVRVTDVAGMLVLLGFAAAVVTDTEGALRTIDALLGSEVQTALGPD